MKNIVGSAFNQVMLEVGEMLAGIDCDGRSRNEGVNRADSCFILGEARMGK